MAFYGIPTPGLALTASTAGDSIQLFNNSTAVLSGNTIIGLNGNDIINLGAEGYTAQAVVTGSATISGFVASGAIPSGTLTISGSLFGQDAIYESGRVVTGTTASGGGTLTLSGVVTVSGVVTSENSVRRISLSQIYGNQDNDSIALGNQLTVLSASTIGGGAGNDVIGTYTYVNQQWTGDSLAAANLISNTLIEAGGGNDRILIHTTGDITTATIQGGAGNDSISFSGGIAFTGANVQILGGGDEDLISAEIAGRILNSTIAGGGGNDTINFTGSAANGIYIAGDVFNVTDSVYDGSDILNLNYSGSGTTVQGGGGNDSIVISGGDGNSNLWAGNLGNDTIFITTVLSGSTVAGGAGNDSIRISGNFLNGSVIYGGGDKDTIDFTVMTGAYAGSVYGGQGADVFTASGALVAGDPLGMTFSYSGYADSTISAMDSIAIGGAAASSTYILNFDPAGVAQGSFSAANGAATGTNGVVVFTSTFDSDLTSRVAVIDASMSTLGATVVFRANDNQNFVFIQGGTTDLLTRIGTAQSAIEFGGTLTVAGGKTITVNTI